MQPDDEIFAAALDLPAAERAAYLDRACGGDAAQRARIEALLTGHDDAANFLASSPTGRAEEKPGDRLGRYTLREKIGEGGCGAVYLAEQAEPVRRRVALKIIKLGMDTRQVIARFEAERQALAMMDHPDIARVFDAGTTDTGRPYFVMEFVDGVPITRFCDEHRLAMPARLELFARVCLAIQHAHQKGVIHRDVKPSNVLVSLHDGVPSPKVIDFGIAKATGGRLTERTLFTGLDQFLGTPAYMSPEQAELRDVDIDTRSDVYSLGVLLYELLTGRPPFDPKSLVRAGVDEIRRIIREVDPPRPSTRVSTLDDGDRATVAQRRRDRAAHLTSVLRGDLDWIVMRCLEKDRTRRYGTAQSLGDDVRRYLRQEPVSARPPDTLYRLRKFVRRHRLACGSAAAIAAALFAGAVVSRQQAVRARRAEATAVAAAAAESLARADAQRRQEQAEDLLTFMLGDFRTELKKVGRLNLLDAVGDKSMAYFAALDPRDLSDTALSRQAKALTQIGEIRIDQARYPEAAAAFATAEARSAALAARHPANADLLFERGQAEFWVGYIARQRGDVALSREWLLRSRDSAAALAALEGPTLRAQQELASSHHNLAVLEKQAHNLAGARSALLAEQPIRQSLLAARPDDPLQAYKLADIASWLGSIAEQEGRLDEAIRCFADAAKQIGTLAEREPDNRQWQRAQVESLVFAGRSLALGGRLSEALATYGHARGLADRLVENDAGNQSWRILSLSLRLQQSAAFLANGDFEAAGELLAGVRRGLTDLVAAEPRAVDFQLNLAAAWLWEARLRVAGRRAGADEALTQARALTEKLVAEKGADLALLSTYAQILVLDGRLALARNEPEAARRDWNRALESLSPHLPGSDYWRLLEPAAQALQLLGREDEARPLRERLARSGYHSLDPSAATLLEAANPNRSPNPNPR